jgi:hypothetical protein
LNNVHNNRLHDGKGFRQLEEPVKVNSDYEIEAFENDLIDRLKIGILSLILVYRNG